MQREPVLNKVVYFVRSNPKGVTDKTCEQDIAVGEITAEALDSYRYVL